MMPLATNDSPEQEGGQLFCRFAPDFFPSYPRGLWIAGLAQHGCRERGCEQQAASLRRSGGAMWGVAWSSRKRRDARLETEEPTPISGRPGPARTPSPNGQSKPKTPSCLQPIEESQPSASPSKSTSVARLLPSVARHIAAAAPHTPSGGRQSPSPPATLQPKAQNSPTKTSIVRAMLQTQKKGTTRPPVSERAASAAAFVFRSCDVTRSGTLLRWEFATAMEMSTLRPIAAARP